MSNISLTKVYRYIFIHFNPVKYIDFPSIHLPIKVSYAGGSSLLTYATVSSTVTSAAGNDEAEVVGQQATRN